MQLVKTASGKNKIKMSRTEWTNLGKKAGWMNKKASDQSQIQQAIHLGVQLIKGGYSESTYDNFKSYVKTVLFQNNIHEEAFTRMNDEELQAVANDPYNVSGTNAEYLPILQKVLDAVEILDTKNDPYADTLMEMRQDTIREREENEDLMGPI